MKASLFAGCCTLAIAALLPSSAYAQASPAPASTPATTDVAATGIADIVVTAERREQSVQRSSLAIEVFSGEALANAGVTQARDLNKLSPGVVIGQGGSATQIYVRGVGDFTSTPITNPAVAVNVDGVYVARSQSIEGNFFDLERVEVLKGPQGTLYGRNSSGGAINLITVKPRLGVTSANLAFEVGNYDLVKAEAGVTMPLGDTAAIRGAFQIVHRNGYATQGLDDDKHESARLQLYWKPSEGFDVRLSADYEHIGGNGPANVFKGVAPSIATGLAARGVALPSDPRANGTDPSFSGIYYGLAAILNRCIPNGALATAATSAGPAPIAGQQGLCPAGTSSLYSSAANSYFQQTLHVDNEFINVSGEVNADLGPVKLTIIPAYRRVRNDYASNVIFTFNSAAFGPERSDMTSVEARLSHTSDHLKIVGGLYYFNEDQNVTTRADAGLIAGGNTTRYALSTKSYAAFGQATIGLTDTLRLIAGARYSVDDKRVDGAGLVQYPATLFDAGQPCFGAAALCPRDVFVGNQTFKNTSFRAGVEYDIAPRSMIYATVARGYKSGGFNPFSLAGTVNTASFYRPEQVTAYEVGSRNRFFDNRVQINVEGFYWKYKDAQEFITTLNRFGGGANALTNAGQATIYGADVEIVLRPSPHDNLQFGAEYLHTKFDSFVYPAGGAIAGLTTGCAVTPGVPFPTVDCSGNPLPRSAKFSGTASYTHSFDLAEGDTIDASVAAQFSSSKFLTIDFTAASKAAGYAMFDANLTYRNHAGWSLYAFGRNLTDRLVYTGAFTQALLPSLTLANVAAPRTFGIGFRAKF